MRKFIGNLLLIIALLSPVLVLLGIWEPVFRAFHIEQTEVSDETVLASRDVHFDQRTQELLGVKFRKIFFPSTITNFENIAEDLVRGVVDIETYPLRTLKLPFDSRAVFSGDSHWQLSYAGFFIPEIFLDAYMQTNRPEFLLAALDFILGWDNFEKRVWSPESFVWNDHAVAARSDVLANFWYSYQSHPGFDVKKAGKIIEMAARYASFLSRDINYTFKTNHGVMQNLAILKLVIIFPEVEAIQKQKQVAVNNLIEQFGFFINDDGVILEHSAEYHSFGVNLISTTLSFFKLLDVEIPSDLAEKFKNGLMFLKALRRADDTLPKLGDTSEKFDRTGYDLITSEYQKQKDVLSEKIYFRPESATTFKPASGYAVWWSNLDVWPIMEELAQTAITWSYFPFMGHKHADELSFVLWKGGQEWWTNIGYWPYTDNRRNKAISWTGANGPHLVGEATNSDRKSSILSRFNNENIKVVDLKRQRRDGFTVRRQILNIGDSIWITLDSFDDEQQRRGQVVWNLHPTLKAIPVEGHENFRAIGEQTNLVMDIFFRGADGMDIRKVHGLENPLAGWVASLQSLYPADAFIVSQKSDGGWMAAISIIGTNSAENPDDRMADVQWTSPEEWRVDIVSGGNRLSVKRSGNTISVNNPVKSETSVDVKLEAIPENIQSQATVAAAYFAAEAAHGKRFLPFISYRKQMSIILSVLFVANAGFLIIFRRRRIRATALSIFSFGGFYFWLVSYYFIINS